MTNFIKVPYGTDIYKLKLNHEVDILKSEDLVSVCDLKIELLKKLNYPIGTSDLKSLLKNKENVCIVISDNTRPIPNKELLDILIPYILNSGIIKEKITILIATGSHETLTNFQLIDLLGEDIYKNFNIICNDCYKKDDFDDIEYIVDNVPIRINKFLLNSDFKIVIGLIEPHPFAGFSGGRKSICPGLIDAESFKVIHGTDMVFSKFNEVGMLENNRFHYVATNVAKKVGVDFTINISINKKKKVTNIFCGDLINAFNEGVEFVKNTSKIKTDKKYDLIITHGGGADLDSYYYQLAKPINIATHYLNKNGSIIIFGKCNNGLGTPVLTKMLLDGKSLKNVVKLIEKSKEFIFEQWNAQFLYNTMKKAKVFLFSDIYDKYPSLEKLTAEVTNIEGLISEMKKEKADIKIGFIEDGPFSL